MNYFSPTAGTTGPTGFSWSSNGSISGKPTPTGKLIPRDSWKHLSIDRGLPNDGMMRLMASEFHVTRKGTRFRGATVFVDLDHESGRKLYEWLKKIYEPL